MRDKLFTAVWAITSVALGIIALSFVLLVVYFFIAVLWQLIFGG